MKEKDKKTIEDDPFGVEEEQVSYQPQISRDGVTGFITQTELDEECFTLQESKVMILDKIHRYFHHS